MYSRIEKHYQDGENAQKEMFYDKNGALIADFDRNICTIRNNLLTLQTQSKFPTEIRLCINTMLWVTDYARHITQKRFHYFDNLISILPLLPELTPGRSFFAFSHPILMRND